LFATQNRFLQEKDTQHQENNKTIFCFLVLVIKSMSPLISAVCRRKH